jgi:hypothetical protein
MQCDSVVSSDSLALMRYVGEWSGVTVANEPADQLCCRVLRVVRNYPRMAVTDYPDHPATELTCRLVGDSNRQLQATH